MKKRIGVLALSLVVCATMLLAGCSNGGTSSKAADNAGSGAATDAPSTAKPAKTEYTFVIVPKVVHPWFDEVNKGAQAQADAMQAALGIKINIDYRAPSVADVAEQNSILSQAAAAKPDGIALDPLDADGNMAVIKEIQAQGIPVILFDAPSPEGSGLTSVGNNFAEQAELAAERLVELLGGKGKVAIMQGVPTAPNHAERYEAHKAVFAKYPGIQVVAEGIDNDDIQTAQQQAASILAAHPDLNGFVACDASGPTGIVNAIKEAGKVGKVICVGMDNLKEILVAIDEGTMDSSSSTKPRMQGAMSILMLWQASMGQDIPKTIDTGVDFITKDNVKEFLALVG